MTPLPPSLRNTRSLIGLTILILVVLAALLAPVLAPYDPNEQDLVATLLPPFWVEGADAAHLLGTDSLGRDTLSRLLYGARVAMVVAVCATAGGTLLGAVLAPAGGSCGGWVDWLIGRVIDVWVPFPPVVLSLILVVGLGPGLFQVVLALLVGDWTRLCRVLRAEVMVVRRRDYVAAARLLGFSHLRTVMREILPATLPLLITLMSLEMGVAVVVEAILSFAGMSVGNEVPAWGQMIADARQDIYNAPWSLMLPAFAVFLTVFGFNILGDGLRRGLDTRLTQTERA